MLRRDDQSDRPRGERDCPAGNAGAKLRDRIEGAGRNRIDEQRPLGDAEHVTVADAIPEHGHLREPRLHQPAAGDARGVVVGRDLDVDVEAVALADAGSQIAVHPDKRSGRRGQQLVGLDDAAGLHVGHQRLSLRTGWRVATGAGKSGDEGRPFDPLRGRAPGIGVVADELRVGLEVDQRLDLGALTADRRTRAANRCQARQHRHEQEHLQACGAHREPAASR